MDKSDHKRSGVKDLAGMVSHLKRQLDARLLQGLHERGYDHFKLSHLRLLVSIQDQTISGLARSLSISKQAVSSVAKDLEKEGYLTQLQEERDMRCKRLALTDRGREILSVVQNLSSTLLDDYFNTVGKTSFLRAVGLINNLIEHNEKTLASMPLHVSAEV